MTTGITTTEARTLYDSIDQRTRIAGGNDAFGRERTVIRRMTVDLAALVSEIQTKGPIADPQRHRTWIFTDVLGLQLPPSSPPLNPKSQLVVFARRVETAGDARILVPPGMTVTVYASEWAGSIRFVAGQSLADGKNELVVDHLDAGSYGFTLRVQNGVWLEKPLINFGLLREGSDLAAHLEGTFLYATALYDSDPAAAIPLLRWIQRATASWPEQQDLYLQCSALLCTVAKRTGNARFVPWLSKDVYDREAAAQLEAVRQFEDNYNTFYQANVSIEQRAEAARLMVANYRDAEEAARKVTTSIQTTLTDAATSVSYYENKITEQRFAIDAATVLFQQGIARYQEQKKLEAGLAIAGAVVSFGVAAASAAFGVPDAKALTGLAEAAKTAKLTKEAAETVEALSKMGENLKSMYESLDKIVEAAKTLQEASELSNIPDDASSGDDGSYDDSTWEIFRDRATALVKPAIDEKIDGARDYLLSLTSLAIYGKAVNQARLNYLATGRELARHLLQQAVAKAQTIRMAKYVDDLEQGKAPNEEMMRWILQRYNAVRRWIFVALQNHADAFRYWALKEPQIPFSAEQKAGELCQALAAVMRGDVDTLESFNPPPQDFRGYRVEITDRAALAAFVANRRMVVPIGLDRKEFAKRDRVRLSAVRAWLEGAKADDTVRVTIGAAGSFRDRMRNATFEFTPAWPLELEFEYRLPKEVLTDGAFASEYRPSFFEPTPFTSWTIALPDDSLDVAEVSKVVLEFEGNAIARK